MPLLVIITIAISLSMDAFSLSLLYGTLILPKKKIYILSILVGVFHFFMPLLGNFVGSSIVNYSNIGANIIAFIVLTFIGLSMILNKDKEEKMDIKGIEKLLLFAFAVSIDSFSVGVGLNAISNKYILCSSIFALTSSVFTYIGLTCGKKLGNILGNYATKIGGIVLILIGFIYLV